MTINLIGNKSTFAAEVGEVSGGLRQVDLWAGDNCLTYRDNMAYPSQFAGSIENDIQRINENNISIPFEGLSAIKAHNHITMNEDNLDNYRGLRFPYWGPTTDNIHGYLFRVNNDLHLTFTLWSHELEWEDTNVYLVILPEIELIQTLTRMIEVIK